MNAAELFDKLKDIKIGPDTCRYSPAKCEELVPVINEINKLKKEKNAVILVHYYVTPDIAYGVGDFVGDSYALSKNASNTNADIIVFAAVRFMAETAKILNPKKDVLLPAEDGGCTLADSITADEVRRLRLRFPEHTFVCYINTTADVKAECDVCVTSSNCYNVIEAIPNDKIYFLPDKLMGQNIKDELEKRGVNKDIQLYRGTCYVHEEFDPNLILFTKLEHPDVKVVSHPECVPQIIKNSDFVGSTAQILNYVRDSKDKEFLILTECGLSARLQAEMPNKKFVGTCTICKYMKSNTLENILRVLKDPKPGDYIDVGASVREKALGCIEEMFRYTENKNATVKS